MVNQTFRVVTHDPIQDPLPGFVYPGGVSYKEVKEIFSTINYMCPTVAGNDSTPPCTMLNMIAAPIGPYFPQCVDAIRKQYPADTCTTPSKQISCETLRLV